MSLELDDLEGIRDRMYDLETDIKKLLDGSGSTPLRVMQHHVGIIIGFADDLRIDLLDQEDEANDLFMKQHEAEDLGDAKLEDQRSER